MLKHAACTFFFYFFASLKLELNKDTAKLLVANSITIR